MIIAGFYTIDGKKHTKLGCDAIIQKLPKRGYDAIKKRTKYNFDFLLMSALHFITVSGFSRNVFSRVK